MIEENDIRQALHELYRRLGTQKKLAELAGITQSTINAYLSGKAQMANMPLGVFLRLFRDVKIDFFGESTGDSGTDLMRNQLLAVFDSLPPEGKMRCLALVIANFPDKVKGEPNN